MRTSYLVLHGRYDFMWWINFSIHSTCARKYASYTYMIKCSYGKLFIHNLYLLTVE